MHHDVWDYDVPAQPTLFELDGRRRGACPRVAQTTKMGHLFLLDRETGAPLFPVEERPVPQGGVPGETLSPTQPFPTHPRAAPSREARARRRVRLHAVGPRQVPRDDRGAAQRRHLHAADARGLGPRTRATRAGRTGAASRSTPCAARLYVNQMRLAGFVKLVPRAEYDALPDKRAQYPQELYPMEGTPYAARARHAALAARRAVQRRRRGARSPPSTSRAARCSGRCALGTTRDQAPFPMWLPLGAPNLGGSLATAGGLVFIGATTEKTFLRASTPTPAPSSGARACPYTANATPMTYRLRPDGRQFVVVAAGGHGWSEPGDAVVAFALPAE